MTKQEKQFSLKNKAFKTTKIRPYGKYYLKQPNNVEYIECYFDSNLNDLPMAFKNLKKINTKLNFLKRQSKYWKYFSRRLLEARRLDLGTPENKL